MAPALIEAAATVSQSSEKKLDFIERHLLEDLANNFALRRGIATTRTERTLETNSGRSLSHVRNPVIKSQIIEIKGSIRDIKSFGKMNSAEVGDRKLSSDQESLPYEKEPLDQSSELRKLSNTETCALSHAEGGKSADIESYDLQRSPRCITLKERTKSTNTKVQALERRAGNLKQRVRSFQKGRLLAHVKTQAQLLDYSHKASREVRDNPDSKVSRSSILNEETSKNMGLKTGTLEPFCNSSNSSNSTLTSVLSDSKLVYSLGQKAQSLNLSLNNDITNDKHYLRKISPSKQEVFGVLTNSVQNIMKLDDPDATDPESEDDDTADTVLRTGIEANSFSNMKSKRPHYDAIWVKDRVKIGSMCTWIQAQIADLSHKIKRYGDLHHHIKTNRQQLILEEGKKLLVTGNEIQQHLEESYLGKDDLNGDGLQSNIFARLQAHKNGLTKELCGHTETEIIHEKGVGARTIPVAKKPKHKYIKGIIETAFKGNDISYQCSNLPAPFPCALCLKATTTGFVKTTENAPAVHVDHSYHQQLSTEYDRNLPLLLESSLRTNNICFDKKNLLPAKSVKSFSGRKDSTNTLSQENATPVTSKTAKLRLDKKRNRRITHHTEDDSDKEDSPVPRKKSTPPTAASLLQRRANSLRAPSNGSGESRPATPINEQSILSASCPTPTLSQIVKRKSRTSSEYDINNIVIPYSISSSTRLEKPQYKEILTPEWRLLDGEVDGIKVTEIDLMEDTRDAAYLQRHSRYEEKEHHKFTAFFQLPLKRSRSNRKSSECNTPEPYSPSYPDTPGSVQAPSEFILATPSSAKSNKPPAWTLQLNIDENRIVPWPCRTFPLQGEDITSLDDESPSVNSTRTGSIVTSFTASGTNDMTLPVEKTSERESNPSSLNSSDSELISPIHEQPVNEEEEDEKWTVRLMTEVKSSPVDQGTIRKGIVLKLAKK